MTNQEIILKKTRILSRSNLDLEENVFDFKYSLTEKSIQLFIKENWTFSTLVWLYNLNRNHQEDKKSILGQKNPEDLIVQLWQDDFLLHEIVLKSIELESHTYDTTQECGVHIVRFLYKSLEWVTSEKNKKKN